MNPNNPLLALAEALEPNTKTPLEKATKQVFPPNRTPEFEALQGQILFDASGKALQSWLAEYIRQCVEAYKKHKPQPALVLTYTGNNNYHVEIAVPDKDNEPAPIAKPAKDKAIKNPLEALAEATTTEQKKQAIISCLHPSGGVDGLRGSTGLQAFIGLNNRFNNITDFALHLFTHLTEAQKMEITKLIAYCAIKREHDKMKQSEYKVLQGLNISNIMEEPEKY